MKANIKKISEITGFSPATISNALNNKKGVNKETKDLILKTAQELNYTNDNIVKSIKFIIFKRNGLIIDNSPFFPAVIEGVEQRAKALGFDTTILHINRSSPSFQDDILELINDVNSVYILLGTEMLEEDFALFETLKARMILLDGWSEDISFDSVLISNTDSACKATRYLVKRGHKKIGYLKGDFRIQAFKYRQYGYERVLRENNILIEDKYIFQIGTTIDTAYKVMKELLTNTKELPTAFFADNDVIAIGAMRALSEAGYNIPEDISIIGFDNLPFGEIVTPRLTTIDVHKQKMGEIAVNSLIDKIKTKSETSIKIQVCSEFVERESVNYFK